MFTGVPHNRVSYLWPLIEPFVDRYLAKAQEHRWNATDLLDSILERDRQLWLQFKDDGSIGTVVITEIINYPRCREANVFMVSGELQDDWRAATETLVEWAAVSGCHYISAMARRGFAKAVGWEPRQHYIVRTI